MAEGIAELYQERKTQQEVVQFRSAHQIILTEYWVSFVSYAFKYSVFIQSAMNSAVVGVYAVHHLLCYFIFVYKVYIDPTQILLMCTPCAFFYDCSAGNQGSMLSSVLFVF